MPSWLLALGCPPELHATRIPTFGIILVAPPGSLLSPSSFCEVFFSLVLGRSFHTNLGVADAWLRVLLSRVELAFLAL